MLHEINLAESTAEVLLPLQVGSRVAAPPLLHMSLVANFQVTGGSKFFHIIFRKPLKYRKPLIRTPCLQCLCLSLFWVVLLLQLSRICLSVSYTSSSFSSSSFPSSTTSLLLLLLNNLNSHSIPLPASAAAAVSTTLERVCVHHHHHHCPQPAAPHHPIFVFAIAIEWVERDRQGSLKCNTSRGITL